MTQERRGSRHRWTYDVSRGAEELGFLWIELTSPLTLSNDPLRASASHHQLVAMYSGGCGTHVAAYACEACELKVGSATAIIPFDLIPATSASAICARVS